MMEGKEGGRRREKGRYEKKKKKEQKWERNKQGKPSCNGASFCSHLIKP